AGRNAESLWAAPSLVTTNANTVANASPDTTARTTSAIVERLERAAGCSGGAPTLASVSLIPAGSFWTRNDQGQATGPGSTQNSLPSGSAMTKWSPICSTTVAPSALSLATSTPTAPGARRSKCIRFFARLGSGTLVNQMFGPPQPAASTNALSLVESSSASVPKTAAQNLASATASTASKDTDLITLRMLGT